jgi:hypothetical protein
VSAQCHATTAQPDAFLLQPDPLRQHSAHPTSRADRALCVHHTMPRHVERALTHGASHRTCAAREPDERGQLTVGDHMTRRDATQEPVHSLLERHAPVAPPCSSYRRA